MGLFDNIGNTTASGGGGVYFKDGKYRCKIISADAKVSRKREDLVIIEVEILEVLSGDDASNMVGSRPSQVVNFKHDAALRNVKNFLCAAAGLDPNDEAQQARITPAIAEKLTDPKDTELNGVEVICTATTIITKSNNPFTLHAWSPAG